MKGRWLVWFVMLFALSACGGGAQAGAPFETSVAQAATATTIPVPPTSTAMPPTSTPAPPTATPVPPTSTPLPVEARGSVPYVDDGSPYHMASITLPAAGEGPYPTVVIFHSGAFWEGKSHDEALAAYDEVAVFFAGRGYAAVVPAYRLSQTALYPAAVEDAFCALAWVHAEAARYGFDPTRVAAVGLDAGGNLAALLGTVDEPARFMVDCPNPLPEEPLVHAVTEFNGYLDMAALLDPTKYWNVYQVQFQRYISYYLDGLPEDVPDYYAEASPITWIDGTEPPFAVIHNISTGFFGAHAESVPFADALAAAGTQVEVIEVPSKIDALLPYPDLLKEDADPTPGLDDYGIPQAEAFLAGVFGLR